MYGPAAFRNRACAWFAEVADMYPACLIGTRAVALMGIRMSFGLQYWLWRIFGAAPIILRRLVWLEVDRFFRGRTFVV